MIALSLAVLCSLGFQQPQHPTQPEPVRVSGRVVDMRGDGVVAAKVWIVAYAKPDTVLARATTDGEGFFLIGKVPHRRYWQVWASAEGRCVAYEQTSLGRSVTVTLHDAVKVTGVLKDKSGNPIADTMVRSSLQGRVMFDTRCDTRTDDKGRFTLAAVPLGPNRFSAWVDKIGLIEVRQQITGGCAIEMVANDAATTSIKIDINELPAEHAEDIPIMLLPYISGSLAYLPPPLRRPVMGSTWQCSLLPDWGYTIILRSEDYTFEPNRVKLKPGAGPHELQFSARAIATESIACHASVSADGKPVDGVVLELCRENGTAAVRATTNEQGKLTWATTIPSGQKAKVRSRSDYWVVSTSADPVRVALVGGQLRTMNETRVGPTMDVTLERACEVDGHLQTADGRPAGFLSVQLEISHAGHGPEWHRLTGSTTKRDGSFTFARVRATGGRVRFAVNSSQGSAQSEPFKLREHGARVKLPPIRLAAPAIIEGVVRNQQQEPMPGVTVWLRDWDMNGSHLRSGSVTEVITDKLGRYRFVGVPVGGAWLQFVRPGDKTKGRAIEPFEVVAGKTHTYDLAGQGF